jgi:hypothetical protein
MIQELRRRLAPEIDEDPFSETTSRRDGEFESFMKFRNQVGSSQDRILC